MVAMSEGRLPRLMRGASLAKVMMAALLALSFVVLMSGSANAAMKYSLSIKNSEGGASPLSNPVAVGNDSAGNVYVVSGTNVQKFNSSGKYLSKFEIGAFTKPVDVDVDPSGNVWVPDASTTRLLEFNSAGTLLRNVPLPEKPVSIAADNSGNVWTLSEETAWKLDSTGKLTGMFIGPYHGAAAIDVDTSGQIWVSSIVSSGTVYHYSATGSLLSSWAASFPAGIAGDGSGNVWAALPGLCRVQKFSSAGVSLEKFGEGCIVGGKLENMPKGPGLSLAPGGVLWVSNGTKNEVQKWIP
jgi:streptogramin lyase